MHIIRIIIPTYQKPEQLRKCKEAIGALECPDDYLFELDIIDNNENNIGFTKAVNQGLRRAIWDDNKYCIVLNQDCYLATDFLVNMVAYMDSNPKVAIAGPMQLADDDPDHVICAGGLEAYPNGQHIHGYISRGECLKSGKVHWVNGACMIVRTEAMIGFGLMDENMFLIGSDSDWSFRARYHGYDVAYVPECKCVHEHGITSGNQDEKFKRIMYLDMVAWRNKWIGTDIFRELSMEVFQ